MLVQMNQETKTLLRDWRDERAFRMSAMISWAGLYLGVFATFVDLYFKMPSLVLAGDAVLLLGCVVSVLFSKRKNQILPGVWMPVYLGVWVGTFTSLLVTGGMNSPLLGSYMALLFVGGIIIQSRIRPFWVMLFTFLNLSFWILCELFFPHSFGSAPPLFFNYSINGVVICALMVYVHEFFKTETHLAEQIIQRFEELATTRKRMEKEEKANAAKSIFLAHISHELRTPLGAIMGFAELLRDDDQLIDERRREFSDTILRNGRQLSNLVNDLLDLSKVEAGKIDLECLEFSPAQLFLEVIEVLRVQAQKKGLSLRLLYKDVMPNWIVSDPTRIKQVLMNVIGNAIKFTLKGEVQVRVFFADANEKAEGEKSATIRIEVEDTGPGLTEEQKQKLFCPYTQADPSISRQFGGTGLGLNLSRLLARLLGGELQLSWSRPQEGSLFVFQFPAQVINESQSQTNKVEFATDAKLVSPESSLRGYRFLVVDDTEDNQKLISLYLSCTGAQIDLASNGNEAVKMATNQNYHLILMDVQMPVMDGLSAAQALRAKKVHLPLIALTAHAMKEDRDRCLAAGFDDYITKPVDREKLIGKIRDHVLSKAPDGLLRERKSLI